MVDTFRSVGETLATLAAWTLVAGALLRYFLLEWIKKREQFERDMVADLKAIGVRMTGMSDAHDKAIEFVRSEGAAARDNLRKEGESTHRTLRDHVDHEDKILRDRYHEVDTRTQVLANVIGSMREELRVVAESQKDVVTALGVVNVTLATLKKV
jgi:hypothetical protein